MPEFNEKLSSQKHLSRIKESKLAKESLTARIATRRFIAESCEIAKRLNVPNRLLFLMRFDHGYSTKEISVICKCDETTVIRRIKKISEDINDIRNCIRNGEPE